MWNAPFSADPAWGDLFGGFRALEPLLVATSPTRTRPWLPPTDIHELTDAYVIETDLPGVRQEDLEIEVDKRNLTIKATRHARGDEDGSRTAQLERSFVLPELVDVEQIEAALSDGVLHLRLPKREDARRRRIQIHAGANHGQRQLSA